MVLSKQLESFLEEQKAQVNTLIADASIPKEDKNAQMRKILDIKNLVEEFKAKLEYIETKEYLPHCDG